MPVPQVMEEPAMKQETVDGMSEMPEIIVVSDAVDGNSRPPSRLRMWEETVRAVSGDVGAA